MVTSSATTNLLAEAMSKSIRPARDVFPVCVDEGMLAAQYDGHPLVRGDQSVSGGRDGGQDVLRHHLGAVRVLGQFWVQVSDPPQHPRLCRGFLVGSVAYHF